MQRCFDLALIGAGNVAPNPLVGAVVVHENKIIGEGYHAQFGKPHAEVNAIHSVPANLRHLLPHSALYVNLEPCCHFGKTPPCTDLIIEKGIRRVIFSTSDQNPISSGGTDLLRSVGCEVTTGIMEQKGAWLNRRFFTGIKKKRPYIILKWAQSADGFFTKNVNGQHWITCKQSRLLAHRWRSEEAAILCGTNTAAVDNPQLTNRLWTEGKQPLRIVLDRTLRLPESLHLFDKTTQTVVFSEKQKKDVTNIRHIQIPFDKNMPGNMLQMLFEMKIESVLVEGGIKLLSGFIRERLWDEARVFIGNEYWGEGISAPALNGREIAEETVGDDTLKIFIPG